MSPESWISGDGFGDSLEPAYRLKRVELMNERARTEKDN